MKYKKGTKFEVNHNRSGKWIGIATRDFDTELTAFYPLALAQKGGVTGMIGDWKEGDEMPARASLCTIKEIKE